MPGRVRHVVAGILLGVVGGAIVALLVFVLIGG